MNGGFATPDTPNLADFEIFLQSVQIPLTALPADSPWPGYAFNQALALTVNPVPSWPGSWCFWSPNPAPGFGILYTLAVYNCATHLLLLITPDQPNQSYFANIRGSNSSTVPPGLSLNAISTGLVVTSSDQGSSVGLVAPQWAAGLTVGQLGFMKTPWGRAYLEWAQSMGPTIIGLT